MSLTFSEFFYEECQIAAAELVGPNSPEYHHTVERFEEDDTLRAACEGKYNDYLMSQSPEPKDWSGLND